MRSVRFPGIRSPFARFLALSTMTAWISAGSAFAQSTYNPYEMNSSQFRNFSRPGGSNPFDANPGNRSQSSTYQQEMDKLFGGRETSGGLSRDRDRYYNSFRRYDEEFERIYRPNQSVDQAYNERRTSRESIYFKAFREKDPRRRAELMKKFEKGEDLAAVRDDMKPDENKAAEKRKAARASERRGILSGESNDSGTSSRDASRNSGLLGSGRSSTPRPPSRASGLLNSNNDADTTNEKEDSLTERGRRFSEKIRPNNTGNTRPGLLPRN
jgi:hypothetical protein